MPSHYHLGFLMQNYGREQFGQGVWDDIALTSARYKGLVYPFSKAIKNVTGQGSKEMYEAALQHYGELWAPADPGLLSDNLCGGRS